MCFRVQTWFLKAKTHHFNVSVLANHCVPCKGNLAKKQRDDKGWTIAMKPCLRKGSVEWPGSVQTRMIGTILTAQIARVSDQIARIRIGDLWKVHFGWLKLCVSAIWQSKVALDFCEYTCSTAQIALNFYLTIRIQKHVKLPYYPSHLNESYDLDLLHVNGWLRSSQDPHPFWNFTLSSFSSFNRTKEEITIERERLTGEREKKRKLRRKSLSRCW